MMEQRRCISVPRRIALSALLCCYNMVPTQTEPTLMEERRCSSVPRRIATSACLCCYRTAPTQTQLTIMEQRRCIGAGSPQARPPRALTALWVRKIRSYLEVLSSILSYLPCTHSAYIGERLKCQEAPISPNLADSWTRSLCNNPDIRQNRRGENHSWRGLERL
jgi:hypothetical protein